MPDTGVLLAGPPPNRDFFERFLYKSILLLEYIRPSYFASNSGYEMDDDTFAVAPTVSSYIMTRAFAYSFAFTHSSKLPYICNQREV